MESRIIKLVECIERNKSAELSQIAAFQLGQLAKESSSEVFEKLSPLFLHKSLEIQKSAAQAFSEVLRNSSQSCLPTERALTFTLFKNPKKLATKKPKPSENTFSQLLTQFREALMHGTWEEKLGVSLGIKVLLLRKQVCKVCEEDFLCRVLICMFEDHKADYSDDMAVFPLRIIGAEIISCARKEFISCVEEVLFIKMSENLLAFLLCVRKAKMLSKSIYNKVLGILQIEENEDIVTEACHYMNKFPLEKDQELTNAILLIIEKSDTLSSFIKYAVKIIEKLVNLGCELPKINTKIYLFFVHCLTEVRLATLSAYNSVASQGTMPDYSVIFMLTIQLFILETNQEVIKKSYNLLMTLIHKYNLRTLISNNIQSWAELLAHKNPQNFSSFFKPDTSLSVEELYSFADNNTEEDIKSYSYTDKKHIERVWRMGKLMNKVSVIYSLNFVCCESFDSVFAIMSSGIEQAPQLYSLISKESEGKFDNIRLKALAVYKVVKLAWQETLTLPEKISSIFQAVVTAYKHETTGFLKFKIAKTAARLTFILKDRGSHEKFINNLLKISPLPIIKVLQTVHREQTPKILSLYQELSNPTNLALVSEYIHPSLFEFFKSKLSVFFTYLPNQSLILPLSKIFTQIPESIPILIDYTLKYLNEFPLPHIDLLLVLTELLKTQLVSFIPYAGCIILPLIRHLNTASGKAANTVFSEILYAVLLDQDSDVPEHLQDAKKAGMNFLKSLNGSFALPSYCPRIDLKEIQLRSYQKEGIAWLRFLAQFRLGGLLCDEMGLGKTIQSLCAIAEAHIDYQDSISLIICPASVVGHWVKEAKRFLDLPVFEYSKEKAKGLWVVSYSTFVLAAEKFKKYKFLYVVLDEGHLLSNPKTKTFKSVMLLDSQFRLILTGTPVQNKILDIWPFFEFLMPGFLGTQAEFTATYQRYLKAKKDSNSVKFKDEYLALKKLNALHKKILPFVLRRLKKDMIQDLPEKIIQDYYVNLTTLQNSLIKNQLECAKNQIENLNFTEKVCSHPVLVDEKWSSESSPKLEALKELLNNCEICEESGASNKALIFSKSKKVLDLIEKLILTTNFPETLFLRLDGGTAVSRRIEICEEFNKDHKVRLLLMTTKTGGLGLNLQAASVVIFFDHSWNPVADLQAMDRAHRIGQKKVVNVYRLISSNTLEEEILGLQAFKTKIAESLVNAENSSMSSVDSVNLLSSISKL